MAAWLDIDLRLQMARLQKQDAAHDDAWRKRREQLPCNTFSEWLGFVSDEQMTLLETGRKRFYGSNNQSRTPPPLRIFSSDHLLLYPLRKQEQTAVDRGMYGGIKTRRRVKRLEQQAALVKRLEEQTSAVDETLTMQSSTQTLTKREQMRLDAQLEEMTRAVGIFRQLGLLILLGSTVICMIKWFSAEISAVPTVSAALIMMWAGHRLLLKKKGSKKKAKGNKTKDDPVENLRARCLALQEASSSGSKLNCWGGASASSEAAQQTAIITEVKEQAAAKIEAKQNEDSEKQVAGRQAVQKQAVREKAEKQAAAKLEAVRLAAARNEAKKQVTAKKEIERREAEKREAEKRAAAKKEAERKEAATKEAEKK
jgi:hypothetical protein